MASSLKFLSSINPEQLELFPLKAQKVVGKSKKQKKQEKRAKLMAKLQESNGIIDDDEGGKRPLKGEKEERKAVESMKRDAFTPGWMKELTTKEALPIKQNGKVIRTLREEKEVESDEESDGDDAEDLDDQPFDEVQDSDEDDYEFSADAGNDTLRAEDKAPKPSKKSAQEVAAKSKSGEAGGKDKDLTAKKAPSTDEAASSGAGAGDAAPIAKKAATLLSKFLGGINFHNAQHIIGQICTEVSADPERSLKRRKSTENDPDESGYKLSDLLNILQHPDVRIVEMTMLSAVILFKDILPGYRIRPPSESEKEVTVKKETKRLRDFESAMLGAYQLYLGFLHRKINEGLKDAKKSIPSWDAAAKMGLSALRCQCELLRAVPHFNFRAVLVTSIVARAAQKDERVSSLCCGTLEHLFKHDKEGEASYEAIGIIAKVLANHKYEVSEGLVRTLYTVRLNVHADEAKRVRRKAKQERRKRKRDELEVEAIVSESDPNGGKTLAMRFQADSLHEVSLIYFRIIKMKIGFQLFPAALEGLGLISHLLNVDMMSDLITLLGSVLQSTNAVSHAAVQLHCIHCALKTLSGPGQVLKMDEEQFITALRNLMRELPVYFERWDIILECIDYSLIKRHEIRPTVVVAFVRLLFLHSAHTLSDTLATTLLAMCNMVLLKYPRVRRDLLAIAMARAVAADGANNGNAKKRLLQDDDEVCDLAMKALRGAESAAQESDEGDGSWIVALLKMHIEPKYKHVVGSMTAQEVATVPMRLVEAKLDIERDFARVESLFNRIPTSANTKGKPAQGSNNNNNTNNTKHVQSGQQNEQAQQSAAERSKLLKAINDRIRKATNA